MFTAFHKKSTRKTPTGTEARDKKGEFAVVSATGRPVSSQQWVRILSLLSVALPIAVSAERTNNVNVAAAFWSTEADSGFTRSQGNSDLASETESSEAMTSNFFTVAAGFKPRWAPSVRLRYTDLKAVSSDNVTASFTLGGVPITTTDTLDSSYDFDFYELNASWRIWRNVFYLDYGLSLQYLEGKIDTTGDAVSNLEEIDTPLPALHIAAGVDLRGQMSINAEVQGAAYSDNSLVESEFTFKVLPDRKSGVIIGYRIFDLEYSTDNSDISVDFRGGFLAARLGF